MCGAQTRRNFHIRSAEKMGAHRIRKIRRHYKRIARRRHVRMGVLAMATLGGFYRYRRGSRYTRIPDEGVDLSGFKRLGKDGFLGRKRSGD